MYREPAGGPPPFDRSLILPGVGVGPAIVGRSTAEDVLLHFGSDCRISRHEPSNEIFELSYDYENEESYEPDRPAQLTRPCTFTFEFGQLESIEIGVYQEGLATREGVRIETSRDELLRLLGPPTLILENEASQTFRYVDRGLDVDVGREGADVVNLVVFRPRW